MVYRPVQSVRRRRQTDRGLHPPHGSENEAVALKDSPGEEEWQDEVALKWQISG